MAKTSAALDGTALLTTFGSTSSIQTTIPASMLGSAQLHLMTVMNPAPGGGSSANVGPWASTGPMIAARAGQTQTLLQNGRVLVTGGGLISGLAYGFLSSAEIFDQATGKFSATGSMSSPRIFHTATLLKNGKVLIAGGTASAPSGDPYLGGLATAELYDPTTGTFSPTGNMTTARSFHTATLLSDGTVLLAGGVDSQSYILDSAEIYDPNSGTFTATGAMTGYRFVQTATLLANGKVLIAGGEDEPVNSIVDLNSAELYDPITRTFSKTGSLVMGRETASAVALNNGTVLLAGGYQYPIGMLQEAEIYDPTKATFTQTGSMGTPRSAFAAALLNNGTVLVSGGSDGSTAQSSAEVYDPTTGEFTPTWTMSSARYYHVATTLADGSVLVTGGDNNLGFSTPLASAEVYPPLSSSSMSIEAQFVVNNPVPTITGLSASTEAAGTGLSVSGTNFESDSEVLLNGLAASTSPDSSSPHTKIWVYPNYAGDYTVAVHNPSPGGGTSNTASLTVHMSVQAWPLHALWNPGSSNPFTATVLGANDTSVTWTVQEGATGGSIDSTGMYTAPTTVGTYQIVATSNADPTQSSVVPVQIGSGSGQMTSSGAQVISDRQKDSAVLLQSGKVLIAGGVVPGMYLNSAELYDPSTGLFSATGSMQTARDLFSSTLLNDGTVLVAGGAGSSGVLSSAEIYDPASGTFSTTGNMIYASLYHTGTLLNNGQVLIVGGADPQIYDPSTKSFKVTGKMMTSRSVCMTALLPNGKVLILGGLDSTGNPLGSAELYDPTTGIFSPTGSMNVPRYDAYPFHNEAVRLANGKVLVVGGLTSLNSAELYDPSTGLFSFTASPPAYPDWYGFQLTALKNGTALLSGASSLAGGPINPCNLFSPTQIFDPTSNMFYAGPQAVYEDPTYGLATLLSNGDVLITNAHSLTNCSATFGLSVLYVPPSVNPFGSNQSGILASQSTRSQGNSNALNHIIHQ
jgi:hypothetical protein